MTRYSPVRYSARSKYHRKMATRKSVRAEKLRNLRDIIFTMLMFCTITGFSLFVVYSGTSLIRNIVSGLVSLGNFLGLSV